MDIEEIWRSDVGGGHPDWPDRVEKFKALWAARGTENTTVFAGDSYFDEDCFWSDFDETFAGKDALCFGIGATHSHHWEYLADRLLKGMAPRNLVMHIGTNNVYDLGEDAERAAEGLRRMFTVLHSRLPKTKIWYFTVTQRSYDEEKRADVARLNRDMIGWCAGKGWITCIDTSAAIAPDMLRDGVHLKPEHYRVFVEALERAGIEIFKTV